MKQPTMEELLLWRDRRERELAKNREDLRRLKRERKDIETEIDVLNRRIESRCKDRTSRS